MRNLTGLIPFPLSIFYMFSSTTYSHYRHVLREEAPGQHHQFYEDDTMEKIAMFFDPQFEGVFKEREYGGGQGDNESNPIHDGE